MLFHDLARNVVLAQPAGHAVEKRTHLVLALLEHAAHGGLVGSRFCNLFAGLGKKAIQYRVVLCCVGCGEPIKVTLARAAVLDEFSLPKLRKMRGDGALAHAEDLLQLGNGEFFAL